jgi:hypothetical protein
MKAYNRQPGLSRSVTLLRLYNRWTGDPFVRDCLHHQALGCRNSAVLNVCLVVSIRRVPTCIPKSTARRRGRLILHVEHLRLGIRVGVAALPDQPHCFRAASEPNVAFFG